ncbi:unnamed protein product [Chondrus crispus]|uniref:DUF6818 domain-containing protein n=1 Tax=Chondrus crispus TaxID=2769 RepID=R7QPX9_CHOCR|nr:unnamed protein product [Chondrus crispus]CDF39445.1 unnamed protein product [Chondrus crispus]|eukprot:XP_005719356.1 unnamed protein product [Chondrus crispus]
MSTPISRTQSPVPLPPIQSRSRATSPALPLPHQAPHLPFRGPSILPSSSLHSSARTSIPSPNPSTQPRRSNRSRTKATRAGAPNYSREDVTALLDFVEEVEPLGSNHWAIVARKFRKWAEDNERPEREFESLRNKFDKLCNSKKKTGNPSCPDPVRRAKGIGRAIQNKCAAMKREGSSDEEDNGSRIEGESGDGAVSSGAVVVGTEDSCEGTLGSMKRKRKIAATGTRRTRFRGEDAIAGHIAGHIADMSEHIGAISKSIVSEQNVVFRSLGFTKEDVVTIVKTEVRKSMAPTNAMLHQINNLLQTIVSKK